MALRTIRQAELDGFKVDENTGKLYWHDSAVRTEVKLPDWASVVAVVAAAAAVVVAADSVLEHWGNWARLLGL